MLLKPSRAPAIFLDFRCMLAAIELDDQGGPPAGEIGDERADWYLSTKFVSAKAAVSQLKPQPPLDVRLIGTESSGRKWPLLRPHPGPLPHAGEGGLPDR
jgi:hypothetical protein